MLYPRDFFKRIGQKREDRLYHRESIIRDENGRVNVPLVSDLFSSLPENAMFTNAMFAELKNEVLASIDMYNTREKITLNIFESKESDMFNRERGLIGFRSYITACFNGLKRQLINRLGLFTLFLIAGIVLLRFSCAHIWQDEWIKVLLQNVAAVFLWQFVGYMAFEFPMDLRSLHRHAQMRNIEFNFTFWE